MSKPMYKRFRLLTLSFFVQPLLIMAVAGAIAGEISLFVTIGLAVGIGSSLMSILIWRIGRVQLEANGFEW